jgi:hypothetical protein
MYKIYVSIEAETVRELPQSGHFLMQLDELADLVNFVEHLVYGRYLNDGFFGQPYI